MADATSILVHEMGHHHGVHDHSQLDVIGAKVAMQLNKHFINSSFSPFSDDIKVQVFNEGGKTSYPQIILYVYGKLIDVTDQFKDKLICRFSDIPLPPAELANAHSSKTAKPKTAVFHNLHWKHKHSKSIFVKEKRVLTIIGSLTSACKRNSTILNGPERLFQAEIQFTIKPKKVEQEDGTKKKTWAFQEDSIKVKQVYSPWYKIIIPL